MNSRLVPLTPFDHDVPLDNRLVLQAKHLPCSQRRGARVPKWILRLRYCAAFECASGTDRLKKASELEALAGSGKKLSMTRAAMFPISFMGDITLASHSALCYFRASSSDQRHAPKTRRNFGWKATQAKPMSKKKSNLDIPKNIARLASGVVVAQFVIIAASPILTRLYTPEAFGIFAVFSAILLVLLAISDLNYRFVIPIADSERKASHALLIAVACVMSVSVVTTIVVWLFRFDLADLLNVAQIAKYLWLMPLAVLVDTAFILCQLWSIRARAFKRISWAQASQGVVATIAQIMMGLFGSGAIGLVLGKMIGSLSGLFMLRTSVTREFKPHASELSLSYALLLAKEHRRFPLYKGPSSLVGVMSQHVPLFLFPVFFGPAVTGLYALTYRVLQTPGMFIGNQFQRVFLSTAAESKRTGEISASSRLLYRAVLMIGVPSFALFGLIAPELFPLVFGENWRQAGLFAQLITPWVFFAFVGAPFSVLPMVYDKQRVELAFEGFLFAGRGLAIVGAGLWGDAIVAVALLSLVGSSLRVYYLIWAMSLAGHSSQVVFGDLARELLYAIPFLAPTVIAMGILTGPMATNWTLAIALVSMALLAIVLFFRLKRIFST